MAYVGPGATPDFAPDQTQAKIMLLSRTLLLKAEPAGNLGSIDELFALASAMEREAAARYAELAREMQRQNRSDLAAVFTELAAAERDHVESIARWSQSRSGKEPDPALVRWEAPGTFDAETAAEIRNSRLMTPYRALATAVRNEERAFAFWSYIAAFAQEPEVKKAAEVMAREELGHVSALRKERRRAYHREHEGIHSGGAGGVAAERIDASELERCLAMRLGELQRTLGGASASRAQELAVETAGMAVEAKGLGRFPASLAQGDAEALAEALVDAYLESAEGAGDPNRLEELQRLAERAIARLAWLRTLNMKSS
jgi:rubrerythrin